MASMEDLRIRQLDESLRQFSSLRQPPPPRQGWLRTIREALGMSLRQLADRSGLSKSGVRSAELSEAEGTVQLDTLQRLAEAMECDVVYALVPRNSLQRTIENQAERVAKNLVGRVSDSMELERQGVSTDESARQTRELIDELLRERGRDFWDVQE